MLLIHVQNIRLQKHITAHLVVESHLPVWPLIAQFHCTKYSHVEQTPLFERPMLRNQHIVVEFKSPEVPKQPPSSCEIENSGKLDSTKTMEIWSLQMDHFARNMNWCT